MTGRQETYLAFAIVLASSLAYWLAVSSTPSGAPEDLVLEAITNQNLPKVRAHAELAAARALVEAARRYQRAAEQGSVDAQMTLGDLYAAGEGVAKDDAEAARWMRLAADQGHANAQYKLGAAYETGHGVAQDAAEAVRWFRPVAELGSASAQYALGDMYARGVGVSQDDVIAYMWLSLAASQEAPLAKQRRTATGVFDRVTEWFMRRVSRRPTYELTSATTVRDEVADRMTSAQITEAQRLAREWEALHPREP